MPKFLLFIFFFFPGALLLAQDPGHIALTELDGLPSNEVYHVVQDSMGYIWFGTDNGVCRYDGKTFRTFRSPRQKSQPVHNLMVGKEGRIWMGNFSSQIFYLEDDSLYEWQPLLEVEWGADEYTYRYPYLYACFQANVYVYDFRDSTWEKISSEYGLEGAVQKNSFRSKGPVIFGSLNSLWRFEGAVGHPIDLSLVVKGGREDPLVMGLEVPAVGDGILCSAFSSLSRFPAQNHYRLTEEDRFVPMHIPGWPSVGNADQKINRIMQVDAGEWWTLTNAGTARFNPLASPHPPLAYLFKDYRLSCVLKDREGNHWFSTLGKGVIFVPSLENQVYTPENSGDHTLSDLEVRCFAKDGKGRLWIGHQNGEIDVWSEKGAFSFLTNAGRQEVNKMRWDEQTQHMLVAGLGLYELEGKKVVHTYQGSSVKDCFPFQKVVFGALSDRMLVVRRFGYKGSILGWDVSNPHVFERRGPMIRHPLTIYFSKKSSLEGLIFGLRRAWAIQVDTLSKPGFRIWQGYADTLMYTNENGWSHSLQDPKTGAPIHARDIEQGDDSLIWVGTSDQGVYGILDSQVVYHFSTAQGLPNNKATSVFLEEDTVWIGSKEGLIRLVPQDSTIAYFDETDGLVSSEVRDVISWEGDIWIATYKGLQRLKRSALNANTVPPLIRLIQTAVMERDTSLQEGVALPFSLNNLRFDFEGLAFRSKGRFRGKYRMLGLDSAWVSIPSSQKSVRFPSLPPGDFQFELTIVNEDGVSCEKPISFPFSIRKPWYQTWWFYGCMVLAIFGVIYLGFSLRLRQERTRRKFERQLDTLRMTALQAQMNPHFIFNALNAIQYYFTANQAETALSYLSKFSRLIRTIFEHARLPRITMEEEISFLKLYCQLEQLRFEDKVQVVWEIDGRLDEGIEIPPLLIQPILENSFKYGLLHKTTPGLLTIRIRQGLNQVYVCVEDDGVGREAAMRLRKPRLKRQQSAGIATIEERLKIHNGELRRKIDEPMVITDLYDPEGTAAGTRVEMFIGFE